MPNDTNVKTLASVEKGAKSLRFRIELIRIKGIKNMSMYSSTEIFDGVYSSATALIFTATNKTYTQHIPSWYIIKNTSTRILKYQRFC